MTFVTEAGMAITKEQGPIIAGIREADRHPTDAFNPELTRGSPFQLPRLSNWRSSPCGRRS
jgi:hypothetical protein